MSTPVVLVSGVDPQAMTDAVLGLAFDLPRTVAVRHHIDPVAQVLERVVSDVTGVVEHERIPLEHVCVTCALREDVVPTLDRLARDGRWASIVAHLPVGAPADQVCGALARDPRLARRLHVSTVLAALDGEHLVDDLLGDDLLVERSLHSSADDTRGVGEVACSMVEYADLVVVSAPATEVGLDLVRTLARPGAIVVEGTDAVAGDVVVRSLHDHRTTHAWTDTVVMADPPPAPGGHAWRLDLHAAQAFHPERLLDDLEALGSGRHRSRGHFWLPTRPGVVLGWDGSGGQLSIGNAERWGRRAPSTRLLVTGVGAPPDALVAAFDAVLLRPEEGLATSPRWHRSHDGFEPWLGPTSEVA